jgi:hypothetical protein
VKSLLKIQVNVQACMLNLVPCNEDVGNARVVDSSLAIYGDVWPAAISLKPGKSPCMEVCEQFQVPVSLNPGMSPCMEVCEQFQVPVSRNPGMSLYLEL